MKASESKEIRISAIKKGLTEYPLDIAAGGICISAEDISTVGAASPAEAEEKVFLLLRGIAENHVDIHITIVFQTNFSSMSTEHLEKTKAITRGVFRAAVYGDFSLMCDVIQNPHDYEAFCSFINKIFCELESENREFNGYISKGMVIGSPSTVLSSDLRGVDFLCIDLDRMIPYLLCNGKTKSSSRKLYLHGRFDSLCESLVEYFSEVKCPVRLKTYDFANNSFIFTLATSLSAEELIIPFDEIGEIKQRI